MGILKGILRTAKELYNADKNDQLDEYIDGKISNVIKKLDGTETAEFEDIKENRWQEICELLNPENSEEFDNDFYQDAVDIWREEFAQSTQDSIQALYGKYLGWLTTFNLISDEISDEEQETQTLVEKMEEANAQCLKNIRDAIELLDEDTIDWWICTLYTAKAERLHWVGVAYKGKNEHVEAVRLAIQALPFACNDEERERLINKYFDKNASRQKAEIRAGLKKLDEMIENACKEEAEITKFTGGLINNYVW